VALDENPLDQVRRLVRESERLRVDATRWQNAGSPETARELRVLATLLARTIEQIERAILRARGRGIPTLFDP
jgi:hypothetical protein